MRKHKVPSEKALKAISLYAANPGMTKQEAALQAGYSSSTAKSPTKNIFGKPIIKTWLDNFRYTLEKRGLTQDRIALELDALLKSTINIRNKKGQIIDQEPDKKIKLETIKVYNDIFGVKDNSHEQNNTGVTRRITLEEFEEEEGILEG